MKKGLFTLTALFLFAYSFAQTPQAFKYQAVARDLEGNPISNQEITIRVSILSGSPEGVTVYSELHEIFTNEMGLFTLEIGNPGMVISGNFSSIGWGTSTYFLKIEIDPAGGFSFQLMGTSQLLSVPYALYAENVAHNDDADADPENELQTLSQDGNQITLSNGGGTVTVSGIDNDTLNEIQHLTKNGNIITLSKDGGSFTDENTTYQAGSGLQLNGTTFINSAPDQTVSILAGNGISRSGAYPSFIITNTKPDQTVVLQGTGAATVSGNYPNFTVNANPNDTSAINELQTLTQVNNEVTLSKGGGSVLTGVKSYTQSEIDALTPYSGLTVHNSTTNCINYFYQAHWYEACGRCLQQPTTPSAGADQININGSSTALSANTPVQGTGQWTIISGEGGSFSDPYSPTSSFTGVPAVDYLLAWTISNSCVTLSDIVNIRFWDCGLPITDSRDGKSYKTVQIGDQCWMAQNLNYGNRISTNDGWSPGTKYCYNNEQTNCDIYGGLYRSIFSDLCPQNWHVPSSEEFTTLIDFLGGTSVAGGKMRETGTNHWFYSTQSQATNSSGFTALGGGFMATFDFSDISRYNFLWSSSYYGYDIYIMTFNYQSNNAALTTLSQYNSFFGCSVRCLKDY